MTYRPFKQSVNMCVGSFGYSILAILIALCMTISYALNMFCSLSSLIASSILLSGLYIPYPAISYIQWPLVSCGGRNEPSV